MFTQHVGVVPGPTFARMRQAQTAGRVTAPGDNEAKAGNAAVTGIRASLPGGATVQKVGAALTVPIAITIIAIFVIDQQRD